MKLFLKDTASHIADMGVSPQTVTFLKRQKYDAVHLNEQGLFRLPDREIMAKAKQESRIVLTFDLDFTDLLAASRDKLPSIIIFRVKNTLPNFINLRLMEILSECAENLRNGAIIIVEDYRYRVRNLPLS